MTEAGRPWRSLSAGEAQLRAILDAIPARVALLDRERRHCYVNREYAEFLGLAPDAVLGRTVAEVVGETGPTRSSGPGRTRRTGKRAPYRRSPPSIRFPPATMRERGAGRGSRCS